MRRVGLPPGVAVALAAGCAGWSASSDPCAGVLCSSHGTCVEVGGSVECLCETGYHPVFLACVPNNPADPCDGVDCSGHGTCRDAAGSPICDCLPGYHNQGDLLCVPDAVADGPLDDLGTGDADARDEGGPGADADADGPLDDLGAGDADGDAGPGCGNGVRDPGEECDDGNDVPGDGCEADCRYSCHADTDCIDPSGITCSSGCDPGLHRCAVLPAGTSCRPSSVPCDAAEVCDGMSPACPPNMPAPAGTPCRPARGDCDVAETCGGSAFFCPEDGYVAGGTICRYAVGLRDAVERCTGSSASCPPDLSLPEGSPCSDGDACTTADRCNASGGCVGGPPPAPPVPHARVPENGARTGSPHPPAADSSLRPVFRWAQDDDGCGATTVDLQADDSCSTPGFAACSFPSPELDVAGIAGTSFRPAAGLAIGPLSARPVGRRYYWRARASRAGVASAWSPVRYVDVGRAPVDFDGDGYSEAIAGAPGHDFGGDADVGVVYVYYGGTALGAEPDLTLRGGGAGERFGTAVADAGDVNADGFGDVLVGAPNSGTNTGVAYLFLGSAAPDAVAEVMLDDGASGDGFGSAVAGAGDVNADGHADVVVGAPHADSDAGRVFVFLGGAAPEGAADLELAAEGGWNSQFGFSVAGGGDVNGDGYADVMGGAPYFYEGGGGYDMGRGLLFFGGSPMDATAEAAFGSGDLRAHGGWSVAILGDVNGDGLADFAVASPDEPAAATRGIVRIHYGAGSWAWAADLTLRPGADVVRLGHAVAGAGDVNGDGYDDVIVGAPDSAGGTGRALIYLGGAAPDTVEDVTFSAATADQLGYAVGGVGDVNGDGYADVLLGAPYYDGAGPDVGRVHGCWGGVAPGAACDSRAGLASGDLSGYAVGGAP